jgi:hypothetical protein
VTEISHRFSQETVSKMEVGMVLGLMGTLMLTKNASGPVNSMCISREVIEGLSGETQLHVHFPPDAIGICYNFIVDSEYGRSNNTDDTSDLDLSSVEIANAVSENASEGEFDGGLAEQTQISDGQRLRKDAERKAIEPDRGERAAQRFMIASLCMMVRSGLRRICTASAPRRRTRLLRVAHASCTRHISLAPMADVASQLPMARAPTFDALGHTCDARCADKSMSWHLLAHARARAALSVGMRRKHFAHAESRLLVSDDLRSMRPGFSSSKP